MSQNSNSKSGIGLPAVLGVVFVILKLTDNIDWSWWWVTLPFWAGTAIVFIIAILTAPLEAKRKRAYEEYQSRKPKSRFQQRLNDMQEQQRKHKS